MTHSIKNEKIFSNPMIPQEHKDVLSNLLLKCLRKEKAAIKLVEQKIMEYFKARVINETETKYIFSYLRAFKIPDVPEPEVPNLGRFTIDDTSLKPTKDQIEDRTKLLLAKNHVEQEVTSNLKYLHLKSTSLLIFIRLVNKYDDIVEHLDGSASDGAALKGSNKYDVAFKSGNLIVFFWL